MSVFLNEVAKISLSGGSGTGSLVPSTNNIDPVAKVQINAISSNAQSNYVNGNVSSSSSYGRTCNHGSGQYSHTSRYYNTTPNIAEVYCQPFLINQSTGAITVGSGSTLFSGTSSLDTGWFAYSGNYVVTNHTSASQGNSQTVGVISGNSVTGYTTSTGSSNNQPVSNEDMAYYRSGSTMVWYPGVYNTSSGTAYRQGWSFNGSSISNTNNENPSSTTSTHYTFPVVPKFGQNSPTSGYAGLRSYVDGSAHYLEILNSTGGSYSNQFNINNSFGFTRSTNSPLGPGWGLELSNNEQLFYFNDMVWRSSGGSLSVVNGADFTPKTTNNNISDIFSVAADTWVAIANIGYTAPPEIVKFSIDPSTYKVTIINSVPLTPYLPINVSSSNANTHVSFTGTSNQFMVLSRIISGISTQVSVFPTPF
jgi:hypothetical protein